MNSAEISQPHWIIGNQLLQENYYTLCSSTELNNFPIEDSIIAEATNTFSIAISRDSILELPKWARSDILLCLLVLGLIGDFVNRKQEASEFRVCNGEFDFVDDGFHYIPNIISFERRVNRFFEKNKFIFGK